MLQRLVHKIKKCKQVGLYQAARSVHARYRHKKFADLWRAKALAKRANHTWPNIALSHNLSADFKHFFTKTKNKFSTFPSDRFTAQHDTPTLIALAQKACENIFDLLGSGPVRLNPLEWHIDFRLRAQAPHADYTFPADQFYKDIQITSGADTHLSKDIKVPWELSRFQHLGVLGQAYAATGDLRYVAAFKDQVTHWVEHNPFLLGANWVCPMEVGLRAVNWLWAFYFFKDAPLSEDCWQKFTCSLYDHYVYLENNWELYDGRTSNHYLSDLVGYLYLCYFFADFSQKKVTWCAQRIHTEMARQVCPQGTSYEGSTQYHRLVAELFYHAHAIMHAQSCHVPGWFTQRLERMFVFLGWCSAGRTLMSIGDHDSGSVLACGLVPAHKPVHARGIQHYTQFGLSVLKVDDIHITLRHHAYRKQQPSGHFHNDVGSITLAYNNVPLLVDPGSFVYTPSAALRNHFRSVAVHNTFYLEGEEPVPLTDELFGLVIPEAHLRHNLGLSTSHTLYARYGLVAERVVTYAAETKTVHIVDAWQQHGNNVVSEKTSVWNFTFAPGITLQQVGDGWSIMHGELTLGIISSPDMQFVRYDAWHSPAYGTKERCVGLRAQAPVVCGNPVRITVTKYQEI